MHVSRPLLLLSPLVLAGLALAGPNEVARKRSLPGQKAVLDQTQPSNDAGLLLTDLSGHVENLAEGGARAPERLTCVQVDLDAKGAESAKVPVIKNALWRGLRFPVLGRSGGTPLIDLNELRLKVLLVGKGGVPAKAVGPDTRVLLKIGTKAFASFKDLAEALKKTPLKTPIVLDVASAVPGRHALTVLAIVCNSKRSLTIAAPGMGAALPRYQAIRGALGQAIRGTAKDPDGSFQVGVRVRPDARCSWRSIQAVLTYAATFRISRVTLVGNAGELEIDLFQPKAEAVIARREVRPQEYDEKLKRDPRRKPVVNGKDEVIEKPIIIVEDETEATPGLPKKADRTNLSRGKRDGVYSPRWGKGSEDGKTYRIGGPKGKYPDRFARKALAPEGGNARSEAAVKAAFEWLKNHQADDGSWSPKGDTCQECESKTSWGAPAGDERYRIGVTSLAVLAYLGRGNTHRQGPYKRSLQSALNYLKAQQKADGSIGFTRGETIYNHAFATQAICEAYAISLDETLRPHAKEAVDWILKAQNPGFGWQYGVKVGRNDSSVTGAMLQALLSARAAGFEFPGDAFEGATKWLKRATAADGNTGYQTPGGGSSFLPATDGKFDALPVNTAIAIFGRILEGDAAEEFVKARKHLDGSLPAWEPKKINFYYWYYGTNAQFQLGGNGWKAWNSALQATLIPNQETKGCADGSWKPAGEWCIAGGRAYSTAMGALSLETYYRYPRRK